MGAGRLDGRKALVTGAGVGIGLGVAEALAADGASVALHYASSRAGAQSAAARMCAAGGRAVALEADLSRVAECRRLVDEAASALGGLDILVNSAGITAAVPFLEASEEDFARIFDLNMRGQYFCAQQAARHMVRAGGGVLVNISSVHAFGGVPGNSIYAATKGAIVSWTRELAIELAPCRIRVNCVAPGHIEVPRHFRMQGYTSQSGARSVPWGRVGRPSDVGSLVAYLVSDEAELIVGQTLLIDGGLTAKLALVPRKEGPS